MPDLTKETDARILINDLLRQAGWEPSDKAMVLTEVMAGMPGGASAGAEVGGLSGGPRSQVEGVNRRLGARELRAA
ncbi:MAG TPA: hypothetical protein VNK46_01600 [Nitrospiraceae bacterium]|jgi:type I restriction enzyme R subunit|nr:hypothetical protein [Nitrospiraceae bacterium]